MERLVSSAQIIDGSESPPDLGWLIYGYGGVLLADELLAAGFAGARRSRSLYRLA
jgi:hypothetical protein